MKYFISMLMGVALAVPTLSAANDGPVTVMSARQEHDNAFRQEAPSHQTFRLADAPVVDIKVDPQATIAAPKETVSPFATRTATAKRGVPTTAAALKGYMVGTYNTLSNSSFNGGSTMQIVPDEEGDSLTINRFWSGQPVRAHLDAATGTVTIPAQVIIVDETVGACKLGTTDSTGKPNYTVPLTGTVTADGSIDFGDQWWGVFVVSGQYKDLFVAAYYKLLIQRATGTMTYKNSSGAQVGYYVVAKQTSANVLTVTNIFNAGLNVEMELNRNRTASISSQVALINSNGSWVMIKCTSFNDAGNLTGYSGTITTDAAAADNNTTLTWTDWSLLSTQANAYAGKLTDAVLTCDTPIAYPELKVTEFKGAGTQADPYVLSTLDDLILLSDKVNTDEDYIGGSGSFTYSRTYMGKYFVLANDIDMTGYRFDPIGHAYKQRFAGTLDGQGHTIKGLTVNSTTNSNYSGLFGYTDTVSVLQNIVLDGPNITAGTGYAGALVAYACGAVDNITVINPIVIKEAGSVCSGCVGIALGKVSNITVQGGVVAGAGYAAGACSEAHAGISNCTVTGTKVYGFGAYAPTGGVVANLYGCTGEYLSFAGLVSYDMGIENQYIGGVVGTIGGGWLKNSFSAGVVQGYASTSIIGGVAGRLNGKMTDCYSSGLVYCYSRMTGGIAGQMSAYRMVTGGDLYQPEIHNCYTSASVIAETYQYNTDLFAEAIGSVADGTEPVIENVYFDRQVTNFGSKTLGTTTAALTAAAGPEGFSADNWTFTAGAYPRVKALADTENAKYASSAVNFATGDSYKKVSKDTPLTALGNTKFFFVKDKTTLTTEGHYATIENNNLIKIGEEFGCDTLYVVNGDVQTYHFLNVAPIPFAGQGTEEEPFLIQNKADLIALSKATTEKLQIFEGNYFKMTANIDVEYDKEFRGISANETIAASSAGFQGVFDGGGFTVDRMIFEDEIFWSKEPTATSWGTLDTNSCKAMKGLFGRLGDHGVVKNVNVGPNCKFTFYAQSAAIVGNNAGRVENCRNYSDIVGYSCWIGGIVGNTTKTSYVTNCYNAGNITTGYAQAGGIAGSNSGYVYNSVNTGDIRAIQLATNYNTQLQRAGGICGGLSSGYAKDCVNFGTVWAQLKNAGGISGSAEGTSTVNVAPDSIINAMNFGNVYSGDKATLGAVAGLGLAPNAVNCYYDLQTIGLPGAGNTVVANITGATTAFLTSGTPIEGYDTELWDFSAGKYPVLKQFADEPKVVAARQMIMSMPADYTVADFLTEATVSGAKSMSFADGSVFKVEGNKVIGPESVQDVVSDTLNIVNEANVVRPILLTAKPSVPLEGKGTAEVPYLIKTTNDWVALATYMQKTGDNLVENFVAIDADLDCGGADVPRLCADNVTRFEATLDGRNHTVSNFALKGTANTASALIGTIGENGTVKNLTLKGTVNSAYTFASPLVDKLYGALENITSEVDVTTNKQSASGVAGTVYGGSTLTGITVKGTITSTYTSTPNLGGIAATVTVTAAQAPVAFKDCTFEGKLVYDYANITKATVMNIGGMAGTLGTSTFDNCVSKGEISLTATTFTTTVGGFAGTASGVKDNGRYEFTNCVNETPITAGGKIAGFIAAPTTTAANAQYIFTDCENKADLTAASTSAISSAPTAGIITNYTPGSRFTRCSNSGTLVTSKNVYTAGIAGYYAGTAGSTATPDSVLFTDCFNTGAIVADGNQGGGIVGYVSGAVILTNCYNTADIEGNQMVGGICSGFAGNGPKMINCYNTGNVTAAQYRAGGLISWGAPTATNNLVEGCWNTGNVTSTSEVGATTAASANAVGGLAGASGANFKNCYSTGTVKGLSQVGGLVGVPTKNNTTFENCYFAGTISAPADSCGSVVGVNTENGKIWTESNTVKNCFYLNTNKSDNDSKLEGAKAVSVAELCALDLGEGFDAVDNYTEPVVKGFAENENAMFYAAQLIVNEADAATPGTITKEFNVGGTPVVTWTASVPAVTFSGDQAQLVEVYNGPLTVTKKAGELEQAYQFTAAITDGVDSITADSEIVSETYFTPAGVEVSKPAQADGQVYIVVRQLTDGSTKVVKVVNK